MTAPWGLPYKLKLALSAWEFFHFRNVSDNHAHIGKELPVQGAPAPFTVMDFIEYLKARGIYAKTPNDFRVAQMLDQMANTGILVRAGHGDLNFAGLQDRYMYMPSTAEVRRELFSLAPVLGPELLYALCARSLVHITGTNEKGDEVAGTGFVVDQRHVLTCRHVVSDMAVDDKQVFQGESYAIGDGSIHAHPDVDIAVIRTAGASLTAPKGATFLAPVVAQTVYTLGYPKLPGLKDASVTMQQGVVTNESVTSLTNESLFLYSAISRPGNSGGPVVSEGGYVVGLSIVDATGKYTGNEAFSPHYAGIPAQVVVRAVEELGLDIEMPFEKYE